MNNMEGFRTILEQSPDIFLVHETDGRISDVNLQACQSLGYSREELLQLSITDIEAAIPPDRAGKTSHPTQRDTHTSRQGFWRRKNGDVFPVELRTGELIREGRKAIFVFARDVDENRRLEAQRERVTRIYRALSEINQAIVRMETEETLFPLVCRIAVELGGMKMAWVGQPDQHDGLIKPTVAFGSGVEYVSNFEIPISPSTEQGRGPTAVAYRESRQVIINDFRDSAMTKPWHDRALRYGWNSSASFPIMRSAKPYAVLALYHEQRHAFSEEIIELLSEMVRDITFALDNFDRERDRLRLEILLRENEERLRLTLDATNIGVWDWDMAADAWFTTPTYFQMLGYDPVDGVQGKEILLERTHPDDRKLVTDHMQSVREQGLTEFDIEFRFRHADGSFRWINSIGKAIDLDEYGKPLRMLGLLIDITERKNTSQALARSEEKFSKTFRNSPNPISISTLAEGKYIEVNDAWLRLTGYDRTEIMGQTGNDLGLWGQSVDREAFVSALCAEGRILDREVVFRTKTQDVTCLVSAEIVDIGKERCIVLVAQDITKLKQAMDTITDQRNFLETILENEPECVKVVSLEGNLVQINQAGLVMLEVDSLKEAQRTGLLDFIPPENRTGFTGFHKWVCEGNSGMLEFPIIGKRGTKRWLETHASPLRNAAGRVVALLGVSRDITERKHSSELIWRQANYDPLTDLPNRYMFFDRLEQEVKKAHRDQAVLAVLFIDLDRFKEVNDSLGHPSGDRLLVEAANRIGACVRESDTVARLGGDEFTVILSQLQDTDHVELIAHDILTSLQRPFFITSGQPSVHISASIGITLYPTDAVKVDELLRNADQAMYAAKNAGRNRFSYFTKSLQEKAQARIGLINELHDALAKNQFLLFFQPIVDLSSRRICKAEALLRWRHPTRGLISPMEFIPVAEETRLIIEIGDWVFRETSRWASRWAKLRPGGIQISVNMSPVQFQSTETDIDKWIAYLQELDLSGQSVAIEITEGLLLNADASITEKLIRFRDADVQVAIDDFGTGYSALSYLKKFDIDYLKIDQTFVRDLATDVSDRALSEAVIVMAHKLGLKVIAEGIETAEQRDFLIAAGCDFGQGYLISKPLPPGEFEALWLDKVPRGRSVS